MKRILNHAFPIVAAALGNKLGVKVRVGGRDAYTNGDIINVPAYDGDDPGYRDVAWGYLAHEAAHVRYTAFDYFRQAASRPIRKAVLNILEDVRIEKRLAEIYPGTRLTIEKTVQKMVAEGDYAVPQPDSHPAAVLQSFLLFHLRSRELGQTVLTEFAERAERILDERFPPGAVTRLRGLLSEALDLAGTRDGLRLTDRILRMLQYELEKARGPSQAPGDQDDTEPTQPDGSSNGSDNNGSSMEDGPDPARQDGDAQHNAAPKPSGDSGNQGDSAGAESNALDSESEDESDHGNAARILQAVLDAGEDDVERDVFELARDGLQLDAATEACLTLPTPDEPPRDDHRGPGLLDRAAGESGRLRASLQGLVQSSRLRRPMYKRAGNRVEGNRLFRIVAGDARVFVRRSHQSAPNTAMHLLVDRSPSMNGRVTDDRGNTVGSRIDLAWEASIALSLALEGIPGVNPAVTAFPGRNGAGDRIFRVQDHGQRTRQRAAYFGFGTDGGTPLAEGLWYAASRLLACQEPRKILLALTDGEPDDRDAARDILSRCSTSGIEVVGIGLGIEVGHLFERSITILRLSELRSRLFELSRDLLIAD
jgi:cobaltochelatase CobT